MKQGAVKRHGRGRARAADFVFWSGWLLVLAASLYLWWRGGMFDFGELPTHGFRTVLAFAVTAAVARLLAGYLLRRRRKG